MTIESLIVFNLYAHKLGLRFSVACVQIILDLNERLNSLREGSVKMSCIPTLPTSLKIGNLDLRLPVRCLTLLKNQRILKHFWN